MQVHQIYTHSQLRNFTYIIELEQGECLVLDPWNADIVNQIVEAHNLTIKAIINTHEHWDHTQGNLELVAQHNCEVWAHENGKDKIPGLTHTLAAGELISLTPTAQLKVLDTPGHTFAHLCFLLLENNTEKAVFTGDTLFNAGVGNCHNGGDASVLYQTISQQFATLSDDVIVYPGHDYLDNNLRFTLNLEPSNTIASQWLKKAQLADPQKSPLLTTIADEKQFNSFFRLTNAEIINSLALDSTQPSQETVFIALREKRNKW